MGSTISDQPPFFNRRIMVCSGVFLQFLALLFYGAVLLVISKMKKKDAKIAPFYNIFYCIGFVDCLHCLALIWLNFESAFIEGPKLIPITHAARFMTCYCYLINIIGNGIMAVNRYSATFSGHMIHFSKNSVRIYLAMTFCIAGFLSIPAFLSSRHYYLTEDGQWSFVVEPAELAKVQRGIIVALMIIYSIVGVVFTYLAYSRIATFIHSPKYHQSDRTLLFFILAHMIFHTWMLVYEIANIIELDYAIVAFFTRNYFVVFYMSTVSNGFFILASSRTRKAFVKCICNIRVNPAPKPSGSNPENITTCTRF